MDIEGTQKYYEALEKSDLCQCDYCINYVQAIRKAYPLLTKYLVSMGVDIEKPFETMPLEVDNNNRIEYISAQYIVLGKKDDFKAALIDGVEVKLATSHPTPRIKAEHMVIEVFCVSLPWDLKINPIDEVLVN